MAAGYEAAAGELRERVFELALADASHVGDRHVRLLCESDRVEHRSFA
ncbi:MAG TPA: hypothetical protein VGL57_13360 [Solirubrobacteraceae bacterium]